MKSVLKLFFALIIASPALPAQQTAATSSQEQAAKDSNAFATDLYAQLRGQSGNLFFSPESISTAFAMAYAGARGQTATQMAHVFHFTLPQDKLHPAEGALLTQMNDEHKDYELHSADALWAEKDARFLDSYLQLVKTSYGAGFHPVDFKTAPDAARNTINQWVEQQTSGKIKDILPSGSVTPATRLVLTNAIYFKGTWLNPFNAHSTEAEDFHLGSSQTTKAQMMNRTGAYDYYNGGTFQELELPYKGEELAMIVLLPKNVDSLPALESTFTAANADSWFQKLTMANKVVLSLPKFTMTDQFELSSTLAKMGMPQAFTNAANFSGMTGKPEFTISAAIHKAFIELNEQGTEAAAATAIGMTAMAMRREEPPPVVFNADHPFLFYIRDQKTGAILFMGRVLDPTK